MKNPNRLHATYRQHPTALNYGVDRPDDWQFLLKSFGPSETKVTINHEPNNDPCDGIEGGWQSPGTNWCHITIDGRHQFADPLDPEPPLIARHIGEGRYSVKSSDALNSLSLTLFLGGNIVQALLDAVTAVELEGER